MPLLPLVAQRCAGQSIFEQPRSCLAPRKSYAQPTPPRRRFRSCTPKSTSPADDSHRVGVHRLCSFPSRCCIVVSPLWLRGSARVIRLCQPMPNIMVPALVRGGRAEGLGRLAVHWPSVGVIRRNSLSCANSRKSRGVGLKCARAPGFGAQVPREPGGLERARGLV